MSRAALLSILLCFAAITVAKGEEDPRLVVEAEVWASTLRGNELDYAFVGAGDLSGGGTVQSLAFDREQLPRLRLAWRFGESRSVEVGATLWEQNGDGTASTGTRAADIGALLASPDFAIGRSLVDSADARGRVRSTVVDLGVRWTAWSDEIHELRVDAGVRLFRYEETSSVAYRLNNFGVEFEEFINQSTDTDGIGPRVGVRFGRKFGRVRLLGGLGLAVVVGEQESSFTDTALIDGSFDRATSVDRPGTRSALVHLDGVLAAEYPVGPVVLSLGYRFEVWQGTGRRPQFLDDVSQNSAVTGRRDLIAEGFLAGVRLHF